MIQRGIAHRGLQVVAEAALPREADETVLREAKEKLLHYLFGVMAIANQRTHIPLDSWGIAQYKMGRVTDDVPLGGNVLQTRRQAFLLLCRHSCLGGFLGISAWFNRYGASPGASSAPSHP